MKTVKLKCVQTGYKWDDHFVYLKGYFEVYINPCNIEVVEKNVWGLCTITEETREEKGFFGKVRLVKTSKAVMYNEDKQLWYIRTTSGEVYRTYEEGVLIKAGLIEEVSDDKR